MSATTREILDYPLDRPLRLAGAAKVAFPDGSMTASGLRREAHRGRLVVERIAGKDYPTLANIERMRELCRVEARGPAFGSNRPEGVPTVEFVSGPLGSSETARPSAALGQARAKLAKLKARSQDTLTRS
jgi:hypothetical protein